MFDLGLERPGHDSLNTHALFLVSMEVTSPARPGQCDAQRRRTRLYYCIEASRGLLFYLFIYPPEFFLFEFLAQWEDAANSSVFSCVGVGKLFRVSASVGVITTQLLLLFLLLLPTIGVASRSISVGLIGYYQLARLLMTTAILLGIADSFSLWPPGGSAKL